MMGYFACRKLDASKSKKLDKTSLKDERQSKQT